MTSESPDLTDCRQHACKLRWRRHHGIVAGSYFLPFPVFLLFYPLPRPLKQTIHRVGAGDVSARSTVGHGIADPHWAIVCADRMRGQAALDPICGCVILGNTECGWRWRGNEDALPMLGDGFAPGCNNIWRQYTEHALAVLQDDGIKIDEVPDAVRDFVCCARYARAAEAVSNQDDLVKFLRLDVIDHICCKCIQRDVFR